MSLRLFLAVAALLGPSALHSQATLSRADSVAVSRVLERFDSTASAAGTLDAAGRAALFTDDAVVINAFGGRVEGRAAIDAFWKRLYGSTTFASSRIERLERRQRVLAPGLVVVDHVERLTGQRGPNSGRELPPRITHITLILRRDAGEWRLVYYRAGDVRDLPARRSAPSTDSVPPASPRLSKTR
jgi:uncharacterized protein (TIGR02246 family)